MFLCSAWALCTAACRSFTGSLPGSNGFSTAQALALIPTVTANTATQRLIIAPALFTIHYSLFTSLQPQLLRPRLHRRQAIPNMLLQRNPQQLRAVRNILALHCPRERLILHLLLHARHLHLRDLL